VTHSLPSLHRSAPSTQLSGRVRLGYRFLEAQHARRGALLPNNVIDEMGKDQTGELELRNAPGIGFGLGFSVLRDPRLAMSPGSEGTWRWGGAYGHSWFVDHAMESSAVAFTNTMCEGMSGRFVNELRDAVHGEQQVQA
jgi:CubicO group peptidase (beta-lactamase class C family)